jgi:hypothetical protein
MKTLVARDFLSKPPSFIQRIIADILGGQKYSFDKKNNSWCLRRRVWGNVCTDGWFIPLPFQEVQYKIYWPYGIKRG